MGVVIEYCVTEQERERERESGGTYVHNLVRYYMISIRFAGVARTQLDSRNWIN